MTASVSRVKMAAAASMTSAVFAVAASLDLLAISAKQVRLSALQFEHTFSMRRIYTAVTLYNICFFLYHQKVSCVCIK